MKCTVICIFVRKKYLTQNKFGKYISETHLNVCKGISYLPPSFSINLCVCVVFFNISVTMYIRFVYTVYHTCIRRFAVNASVFFFFPVSSDIKLEICRSLTLLHAYSILGIKFFQIFVTYIKILNMFSSILLSACLRHGFSTSQFHNLSLFFSFFNLCQ